MNTPKTTPRRLSALDATFLRMETRDTPMHVGSLQIFSIPSGAPADFVKNIVHSYRSARPLCRPWNLKLVRVPLSAVQFSCVGDTSAQLTRDWVLRTSEVMLISTSVGEDCV